jgi:4-hydroxy-3-polyprenylbenzoate decarboxylase
MTHTDLRDWLKEIERNGQLKQINGAAWDVEMGSIVELIYREGKDPKPTILFDEIPGYPKGYRTLFGMLGSTWRIAKTLGLPEERIDCLSVADSWYRKARDLRSLPPKFVNSGPVMENTITGDQIDVLKFPVPRFHELDRNRYLGTSHAVIQRDPDDGWVNLGTYRVMVVDRNRLALHATPGKHGNILTYEKYFGRGKVMPIAIAIGLDPVLWWLSCQTDTPWGVSEYDAAGGIKGEPIEVIKGPYTRLPIPARAEIVVEGECHPGEFVEEGPFGEWHGYYANRGLATVPEPVIRVKGIYHRTNPILTCSQPAVPPHTFTLMLAVADSVAIRRRLEAFGIPGVQAVWAHYTGSGGLFNVISIKQLYSGHARQVGLIASQYSAEMGAYTIVVEEDIDPSNLDQVLWAMVTRSRLDHAIQILPHCHTNNVHPAIPPSEKRSTEKGKPLTAARVVIDACRDLSWKEDWYPIARMSPELRTKITEKWRSILSGLV